MGPVYPLVMGGGSLISKQPVHYMLQANERFCHKNKQTNNNNNGTQGIVSKVEPCLHLIIISHNGKDHIQDSSGVKV